MRLRGLTVYGRSTAIDFFLIIVADLAFETVDLATLTGPFEPPQHMCHPNGRMIVGRRALHLILIIFGVKCIVFTNSHSGGTIKYNTC